MKKLTLFYLLLAFFWTITSCSEKTALEQSLDSAGENRTELEAVLNLYQKPADSLKLRAAIFLIENMKYHAGTYSTALTAYRERLMKSDTLVEYHTFNCWWKNQVMQYGDSVIMKADVQQVNAQYLIRNIERAFTVWQRSPWKKQVNFDLFCHNILPYRFLDECLSDCWREFLYNKYHPLIAGEKDVKRAFGILYNEIWKRSADDSECKYSLDPIASDKLMQLQCYQCCVLLGDICRSVGIPVAIDQVSSWANYSRQGHAWISLVLNDGTYTMNRDALVPQKSYRVDGAEIERTYTPEKDYPYDTHFIKKPSKVWRVTFAADFQMQTLERRLQYLFSPLRKDVSNVYGLTDSIIISSDFPVDKLFLGNFRSGDDWRPIAFAPLKNGQAVFKGLTDSVVYVPMAYYKQKWHILENPFILNKGKKIVFTPDNNNKSSIRMSRKYPLIPLWTNQWKDMLGTYFEASNDPDFKICTRIHTIRKTPVFPNHIILENLPKFRYVRYVCDLENTRMNHLAFFSHGKELKGHVIGADPSDKNLMNLDYTYPYKKDSYDRVYTRGIDFGQPVELTEILYLPKNDGNFINKGQKYELLYYDMGWHSLNSLTAPSYDAITFDKVPANAILLLKNHTEGKEERIFTYKNHPYWW